MAAPTAHFTIHDVRPAMDAYMVKHPTGGRLHITLEDGNIHDDHIEFCLGLCLGPGYDFTGPDLEGVALCLSLLHLSRSQRARLINGWWDG